MRPKTVLSIFATLLALSWSASLWAQSDSIIQYFYDDLGRLTTVVDSSGNVANYAYDAAGNLLSIVRAQVAPSAPAIFNFIPQQGLPGVTVTIQGQGFSATPADDTVKFNGTPATVASATSTQIVATVPPGATTGPISVTVGGVTAQGGRFTVLAPIIASLSPPSAFGYGPAFTLTVEGANFDSGSVVRWNGSDRSTVFHSSSELIASISANDLTVVGIVQVTVLTNGVTSNAATFTVNNVPPAITSLSPVAATAGGGDFVLTVFGSNFFPTSVVQWNGSSRSTVFVGSGELTASISSSDIAGVGSAQVTVLNPGPGGGIISNSVTFNKVPPTINFLSPATATAGGGDFVLTVFGSNFFPTSVVQWNGSGRNTVFVGSGELTASISSSDIAGVGSAQVTVLNPGPGGGIVSNSVTFKITGATGGMVGVVGQMDLANDGTPDNCGAISPAISRDGRFVAFHSCGALVPGDTIVFNDIYLRDNCEGVPAGCAPSTILISAAIGGTAANNDSFIASISADGRFVAFESFATNLVPNGPSGAGDVFLRDTCIGAPGGCTPSTTLVSVASDGSKGNGFSVAPSISADGRFVSFQSAATNLVSNDTNGKIDIFVRDTCIGTSSGCAPSTIRVSVANDGSEGNGQTGSFEASISADGRFVVFQSSSTNLVAGSTSSDGFGETYVRDTCVGATGCTPSTILASVASDGTHANSTSFVPGISADGRFVTFDAAFPTSFAGVIVRDTCVGATGCTPSTFLASVASDGTPIANATDDSPKISPDGRFVVFDSNTSIFVHDTCFGAASGCMPSTVLVSVAADGTPANGPNQTAAISADGRFVVFASTATNLVSGPPATNNDRIFLSLTGF
jgi:YD repeat-containing protein